jgi:hypothetical protein
MEAGRGTASELDRQIREIVALEDEIERRLADLLVRMAESNAWMRLGFDSAVHYAEQRLGLGRTATRQRLRAARAIRRLPELKGAYERGEVSSEAARLVAKMIGPLGAERSVQREWVERGRLATVKRLRDEARLALRRFTGLEPADGCEQDLGRESALRGGSGGRACAGEQAPGQEATEGNAAAGEPGGRDGDGPGIAGAGPDHGGSGAATAAENRALHPGGCCGASDAAASGTGGGGCNRSESAAAPAAENLGSHPGGLSEPSDRVASPIGEGGPDHGRSGAALAAEDRTSRSSAGSEAQDTARSSIAGGGPDHGRSGVAPAAENLGSHPGGRSEPSGTAARWGRRPVTDAEWHASLCRRAGTARARLARPGRMAAARRGSDVFLRLRLPTALALDLLASIEAARRRLERRAGEVPWDEPWPVPDPPGSMLAARQFFVRCRRTPAWVGLLALLEDFVETWDVEHARRPRADQAIHERSGWRCSAPGCTSRRNLENHHVVYSGRGGSDEAWNRLSLCRFRHQLGEHGRLARLRGRAPLDITWRLELLARGGWFRNELRVSMMKRAATSGP